MPTAPAVPLPDTSAATPAAEPGKARIEEAPAAPKSGAARRGPVWRGPTTLANVPVDSTAAAADRDALAAFCAAALEPAQVFQVQPGRDTLLVGSQGTQLYLPADAFELPGGAPGPVAVELREFYSLPDILLAGLSTRSGNQLLETGGMLQLTARTAAGQVVTLREGRRVHLRMPTPQVQPGMELFEGVPGPDGRIDWQLAPDSQELAEDLRIPAPEFAPDGIPRAAHGRRGAHGRRRHGQQPEKADGRWARYPKSERQFRKDLAALIPYPAATVARLRRGRRIRLEERMKLKEMSAEYKERILRVVWAQFLVDSLGQVARPTVQPGADAEMGQAVAAALLQLPRWEPAQAAQFANPQALEAITVVARVRVCFGESGRVFVSDYKWDERVSADRRSRQRQAYERPEQLRRLAQRQEQELRRRAQADARLALRQSNQLPQGQPGGVAPADTAGGMEQRLRQTYYEFDAQGLGWINCDRFTPRQPLVTFGYKTRDRGVVANLVFRDLRSVMAGEARGPEWFVFDRIPRGAAATLVALK